VYLGLTVGKKSRMRDAQHGSTRHRPQAIVIEQKRSALARRTATHSDARLHL
jgi:hypothetical protein